MTVDTFLAQDGPDRLAEGDGIFRVGGRERYRKQGESGKKPAGEKSREQIFGRFHDGQKRVLPEAFSEVALAIAASEN